MALGMAVFSCSPTGSKVLRSNSTSDNENADNIENSDARNPVEIAGVNLNYDNARVQVLKSLVSTQISYTFRAMVLDKDGKLRIPPGKDSKLDLEWKIRFLGTTTGDLTKLCEYSAQNLQVVCRAKGGNGALFRLAAALQLSSGDKSRLEGASGPEIDSISLISGTNPRRITILGVGFTSSNLAFIADKDCADLKMDSANSLNCRVPIGFSGEQNVRVVNAVGSESSSRVSLGSSKGQARGNEFLFTYSADTLNQGQTEAFRKVGLLRLKSDLTWSLPEFVYSASEASHALSASSVLFNPTQPGGPSIFTSEQGIPMESQYSPGHGFAAPKAVASNIFTGDVQKIVFASTSVPERVLGALALIMEFGGNYRVAYSETKDGENWLTATYLSGGIQSTPDSFDPKRSALQLEFDLNGVPHALFEARGSNSGFEATYGYKSGGGWNFASTSLINTDTAGSTCNREVGYEYQYPGMRIDANGAVHISFICNNALFYETNASGMWVKTTIYPGSISAKLDSTQMDLDLLDQPVILLRNDTSLELWAYGSNGWVKNQVSGSLEVDTATLGFDGPGGLHVVWTSLNNGEESKVVHHSKPLNGGEFGTPEVLFQHDHAIAISPYHALVEGMK